MSAVRKFSDDYVYKLRAENEELLGEIRALRRVVRLEHEVSELDRYKRQLGLSPIPAKILAMLIGREVVSFDELCDMLPNQDSFKQSATVRSHVYKIRQKLSGIGVKVENVRGSGYRLTASGKALLREYMERGI